MKVSDHKAIYPLIVICVTSIACIFYWLSLLDTQKIELEAARHRAELHVQQINEAVDQQLDATIRSIDTVLKHLRHDYLHNRKDFDRIVKDVLDSYPNGMIQYVIVIGADGYLAYSSDTKPGTKLKNIFLGDREHFFVHAESSQDRLFISKPIVGRIDGSWLIQFTRPIWDGKRFVGVIGVPVRPDYISNNLWSLHVDPNDMISIVREDGRIIARSRNLEEGLQLTTPSDRPFMHSHFGEHGIFRSVSITDKVPLLFSWRHLTNYPLITATATDELAELTGIAKQQLSARSRTLQAILLVIAFAIWISWLIIKITRVEPELRIAATAFEAQLGISVTDVNGLILRVNEAFTLITGYTAEEVIGKNPRILKSDRHDAKFYTEMWESIYNTGKWEGEIWNRRKNGEVYPENLTITAVKNADGIVSNYVATLTDITLRKEAEDEINHLAFFDALTGLHNRRLLVDRFRQALVSLSRRGRTGALLFIDLDNFKTLNDTLGHDIGDILLQQVANRLESCVREGDTVARLGGDEFMIMLEDLSKDLIEAAEQTRSVGIKILSTLNQPYQLASHEYHSTPSIGATLFSDNSQSIDELMKQADIAMYQSKKAGRNTLHFFDPKMQEAIDTRANLEQELRNALEKQQFQLYFQLQVAGIQTNGIHSPIGAEVLIRWIHPEQGMISPAQFIPLAEETGLILPIGQWVLDTAFAQIKKWEKDVSTQNLVLAVNVSAKQLRQPNFVRKIEEMVKLHAINPTRIKLELTESLLLEDIEGTISIMNKLNQIGFKFSLDDFGTGYSSLQYLKRLPLSQLKIDQSFVRDIASDNSDQAIVRTVIAMAKSMNLNVIAEGVESKEQLAFLMDNSCYHFQGYLFGKPMPIEPFEDSLRLGGAQGVNL